MYDELVGQRNRELMHVANVVGGVVRNNVYFGDGDRVYDPIASARQREAVAFLNANAFQTPATLITPDILARLESNGAADRIVSSQKAILRTLLDEARIKRMAEHAARDPETAYAPVALFDDLHAGIWGELKAASTEVDLYRRNLQRAHVEILISNVEETKPTASDLPALCRGELKRLLGEIDACLNEPGKAKDRTALLHLEDLKARITQALDPHYRPAPAAPASPRVPGEAIGD